MGTHQMLLTCHRAEMYTDVEEAEISDAEIEGVKMRSISGHPAVLTRLVSIATGLKSQIIGESAIYHQVADYVQSLNETDLMKAWGVHSLSLAHSLRTENGLSSPSHAILALSNLQKHTQSKVLIVVGAGMVGKEVAEQHRMVGYTEMILISRDRKRARRKMEGLLERQSVVSADQLLTSPQTVDYDLIIGTNDTPAEYKTKIRDLAASDKCRGVVDVSAEIISDEREDTISLRSPAMKTIVASHNASLLEKKSALLGQLQQIVTERLLSS
jgi:glutamyl-tRNA reductase